MALMARTRMTPAYWATPLVSPNVLRMQVDRHEPELVGDHQRREDDQEDDLATAEVQAGEGVSRDAPEDHVAQRHGRRR